MIIHQPETIVNDEYLSISACVEVREHAIEIPKRLWFHFPLHYQPYLTGRSDGFLTSLIMLGMYLGEPVEVRGEVSPRLAFGLQEWQHIFHSWYPRQFQIVDVKYEQLGALPSQETQGKVGAAFSGGLDSLYTFWRLMPENQPNPAIRLSYALFIHGFDIRLSQEDRYRLLFQHYENELKQVGVQLLTAKSNIYQFAQLRIKWELMHGGPLIGTALLLGKLFGKFIVNSSATYDNLKLTHFGTSPLSDHWLSTETLEVLHFGSDKERVEKMISIKNWSAAHRMLRVCSNLEKSVGIDNCGRCVRCLLNKTRLELLGILPEFTTFTQPFSHLDLLRLAFAMDGFPGADRMVLKAAKSAHRWDIAFPMMFIYCLDFFKRFIIENIFNRLSLERRYQIKRYFYRNRAERSSHEVLFK